MAPAVSPEQGRAMCAACHGKSKRGIPRKVGCEFCKEGTVKKAKAKKRPMRSRLKAAAAASKKAREAYSKGGGY